MERAPRTLTTFSTNATGQTSEISICC